MISVASLASFKVDVKLQISLFNHARLKALNDTWAQHLTGSRELSIAKALYFAALQLTADEKDR